VIEELTEGLITNAAWFLALNDTLQQIDNLEARFGDCLGARDTPSRGLLY
jgi:hypothetical protein